MWAGNPLAVEVATGPQHLQQLETMLADMAAVIAARVDVLAPIGDESRPAAIELDVEAADEFLEQAPAELERVGIELIGPEHLVRATVAVRGRAAPAPPSDRSAGLNRETIVQWTFTAAADDEVTAISDAELARAEQAGTSLLYAGHRWVRIDPRAVRKARARHESYLSQLDTVGGDDVNGEMSPLALLHLAAEAAAGGDELGLDDHGASDRVDGSVVSAAWSGLLLGGLPDTSLGEEIEPPSFTGELRPYQRRGLSWLRFLDRLGLGGCLADDMGLGKTATTLAHLVDRPGPHLVVCPLSVVHNWETEAGRFTPSMAVTVTTAPNDTPPPASKAASRPARSLPVTSS